VRASRSDSIHRTLLRNDTSTTDPNSKCFIAFPGGTGNLVEKEDINLWMWIILTSNIWFQFIVPLGEWMGLFHIWRPRKVARGILALLFVQVPFLFLYIWNVYWAVKLFSANQHLVDKSEGGWGFGQVGAVVALIGWVHTVVFSYLSKFSQSQDVLIADSSRLEFKTKRQRSKTDEVERVGLLSSQHGDFVGAEEMAMGSTSAPRLPEQRRTFHSSGVMMNLALVLSSHIRSLSRFT